MIRPPSWTTSRRICGSMCAIEEHAHQNAAATDIPPYRKGANESDGGRGFGRLIQGSPHAMFGGKRQAFPSRRFRRASIALLPHAAVRHFTAQEAYGLFARFDWARFFSVSAHLPPARASRGSERETISPSGFATTKLRGTSRSPRFPIQQIHQYDWDAMPLLRAGPSRIHDAARLETVKIVDRFVEGHDIGIAIGQFR